MAPGGIRVRPKRQRNLQKRERPGVSVQNVDAQAQAAGILLCHPAHITRGDACRKLWGERNRQMPAMAFVVLAGMLFWLWAAVIIVAVFLGRMQAAVYSNVDSLLATGPGIAMLVAGSWSARQSRPCSSR
jgi:hypothetical protein